MFGKVFAVLLNNALTSIFSHSTEVIRDLPPDLQKAAVESYADALRVVFICQAAINVLVFITSMPIQESFLP